MSDSDDPAAAYVGLRFGRRGSDIDTLSDFLTELVATDPRNALPEGDNVSMWQAPVIGIAAADDPLFETLKEPGVESEIILQRKANYSGEIRDFFVAMHRSYAFFKPDDKAFVARLQSAADWLAERKVLPEKVTVSAYLASA